MKFGIGKIEMRKEIKIYITIFSVIFTLIGSCYILLEILNNTLEKNSQQLEKLTKKMIEKEREITDKVNKKEKMIIVVNAEIVNIDFKDMKIIIDDSNPAIVLESEKILSNLWFLKNSKLYLDAVRNLKNVAINKFIINSFQNEKINFAAFIATAVNYKDYQMEEILINPFFNIKWKM